MMKSLQGLIFILAAALLSWAAMILLILVAMQAMAADYYEPLPAPIYSPPPVIVQPPAVVVQERQHGCRIVTETDFDPILEPDTEVRYKHFQELAQATGEGRMTALPLKSSAYSCRFS